MKLIPDTLERFTINILLKSDHYILLTLLLSQVPLVVADSVQSFTKTKQAVEFLRRNKAWADVAKVKLLLLLLLTLCPGVRLQEDEGRQG